MILYRHEGASNNLASIPPTTLPLTNSGSCMCSTATDLNVSKDLFAVVVILFSFQMFGITPGGKALLYIIVPVLAESSRQTKGLATWIWFIVFTLTIAIEATSLVRAQTVLAVGMNTKASRSACSSSSVSIASSVETCEGLPHIYSPLLLLLCRLASCLHCINASPSVGSRGSLLTWGLSLRLLPWVWV